MIDFGGKSGGDPTAIIAQELGQNIDKVISQKVVTDALGEVGRGLDTLSQGVRTQGETLTEHAQSIATLQAAIVGIADDLDELNGEEI